MVYNTDPYIESIRKYREALILALDVANDPFKAPEQVVGTAARVVEASWNMQVEYYAMLRSSKNETV